MKKSRFVVGLVLGLLLIVASVAFGNSMQVPELPDGVLIGNSPTSKIGFYGAAPVVQPTGHAVTTPTSALSGIINGGAYGFTTAAQMQALVNDVANQATIINTILNDLGKTSGIGILTAP